MGVSPVSLSACHLLQAHFCLRSRPSRASEWQESLLGEANMTLVWFAHHYFVLNDTRAGTRGTARKRSSDFYSSRVWSG